MHTIHIFMFMVNSDHNPAPIPPSNQSIVKLTGWKHKRFHLFSYFTSIDLLMKYSITRQKKIYCNICFFVSWWTVSNTTMEIAGFIYYLAVLWRINYWCNLLHNWCLYKSSLVIKGGHDILISPQDPHLGTLISAFPEKCIFPDDLIGKKLDKDVHILYIVRKFFIIQREIAER